MLGQDSLAFEMETSQGVHIQVALCSSPPRTMNSWNAEFQVIYPSPVASADKAGASSSLCLQEYSVAQKAGSGSTS